LLSVLINTDV